MSTNTGEGGVLLYSTRHDKELGINQDPYFYPLTPWNHFAHGMPSFSLEEPGEGNIAQIAFCMRV